MARVDFIESKILKLEGFAVRLHHRDGRDVRGDLELAKGYPFQNAAPRTMTVADWKRNRFEPEFAGFTCTVLDGSGQAVPGNTLLATVRDSYGRK